MTAWLVCELSRWLDGHFGVIRVAVTGASSQALAATLREGTGFYKQGPKGLHMLSDQAYLFSPSGRECLRFSTASAEQQAEQARRKCAGMSLAEAVNVNKALRKLPRLSPLTSGGQKKDASVRWAALTRMLPDNYLCCKFGWDVVEADGNMEARAGLLCYTDPSECERVTVLYC